MNRSAHLKQSILFVFLVASVTLFGQTDSTGTPTKKHKKKRNYSDSIVTPSSDYYAEPIFYYDNHVYLKNIRTVQLYEVSFELSSPIIQLNTAQKLKLGFDDLEGGLKNLNYTLIHCSANWEPSNLSTADYITGYNDDYFTEHKYSFNTLQQYTHYSLVFPNDNMKITKSGNYIIKVYMDGDPNKLVLSRRFMVFDPKVSIDATIKPATIVEYRFSKQEIDFTINHAGYTITNPFGDLNVVVMQNNRKDNAITKLKPLFLKGDQLVYDYDQDNVFNGGNEFRYVDLKSLRYWESKILKVTRDSSKNNVKMLPDEKRSYKRYFTEKDINGKFIVKINEGNDYEREADYAYTSFFLPCDSPILEGNLYIFGGLTDWNFSEESKMKYNEKRFGYEITLYLKQGYYNYEYVLLRDNENVADESFIEGSHQETENEYTILVYHHAMATNYDQLIGIKQSNSIVK